MLETFPTSVIDLSPCGPDVVTLRLERPAGYEFKAAQWFRLTLTTEEGEQTKTFTHASAPGDGWLELTTRLSGSAFKNVVAALTPGDEVTVSAAGGRLALPQGTSRVAFLVGGVGITPAHSILRDRAQRGEGFEDAVLFYGNRDEACMPYLSEFLAMGDLGVRVVSVLEHAPETWPGERGFITADVVRRHLDDDGRPFLVAGPPVMVVSMELVLDALGVDSDRRIIERFGTSAQPPARSE